MTILLGIILTIVLISFTFNYLKNRNLQLLPKMFSNETEDCRFQTDIFYKKTEKILTSHRYFYQKFNWFFCYVKFKSLHLSNLDSYLIYRILNVFLLALAVYILTFVPPAGLILALFSITSVLCLIVLRLTRNSWSTPIIFLSSLKNENSIFKKFLLKFEQTRSHLANQVLYPTNEATKESFLPSLDKIEEFSFGKGFPVAIFSLGVLAILQRIFERHIVFDDVFFVPLYLAIPIALGIYYGSRTGFWSGFLGLWMIYSIMIPFSFNMKLNDYNFLADGSNTPILLFAVLSFALGLMAMVAPLLIKNSKLFAVYAFIPWPIACFIVDPSCIQDLSFWALTIISIGILFLLLYVSETGLLAKLDELLKVLKTGKGRSIILLLVIILGAGFYVALNAKIAGVRNFDYEDLVRNQNHKNIGDPIASDILTGTQIRLSFSRNFEKTDTLYLDGRYQGLQEGKFFILKIKSGLHEIEINTEGFLPSKYRFLMLENEEKTFSIELPEKVGNLNLESEPSGAKVILNGTDMGYTPIKINKLMPGLYRAKIVPSGNFVPVEKEYRVEIGKTINDKIVINAIPGILKVSMSPGAVATINEQQFFNTINLAPGTYTVTFSFPSAWGAQPIQKNVKIESQETTEISYFFPATGSIQIVCNPFAQIYIDGRFFKESSAASIGKIIEGEHRILIKKSGYAEFNGTFKISGNSESRLVITYNFSQKSWILR